MKLQSVTQYEHATMRSLAVEWPTYHHVIDVKVVNDWFADIILFK